MAIFKIFKDSFGKYKFLLKSNKGQVVFTSRGYASRSICFNHIQLIKRFALKDDKYERHMSNNNSPYFILKVCRNEIVGVSEKFLNSGVMENIISLIKTNVNKADIDRVTYSM